MQKEDVEQQEVEVHVEANENIQSQGNSKPNNSWYDIGITIGVVGLIAALGMGFYKLFAYENYNSDDDYFSDSSLNVNAYVGGDAYNYIINAGQTTAYFVLGLICMVFICTMMILRKMNRSN
ncbi:hypothetical protein [Rummeliibacillus stabekisii]|uniref:hypothetical protein n=1 Tax=Rummeliibacillus stabekisii TaxID=241244 RepID=UPI00203B146A|nr:hypothetical protein [Rummeliibacillus stabekisii]